MGGGAHAPSNDDHEAGAGAGHEQQGATASAGSGPCGSARAWDRGRCVFVFLHVVFFLVWPPITVLAFRGLLSAIDQVGDISDVKDVPFAPTTCDVVVGSATSSQECCSGIVGSCARCGGPDERNCYCDIVARAVVCGEGLTGAIGNHWGDENIPNSTCTHVCKSVYSEDCAEDDEDAAARLASWGGGETIHCFVSDAGHVRLAAEPASTRVSGVVFMIVWICFWTLPCWAVGCSIYRKLKRRIAGGREVP